MAPYTLGSKPAGTNLQPVIWVLMAPPAVLSVEGQQHDYEQTGSTFFYIPLVGKI